MKRFVLVGVLVAVAPSLWAQAKKSVKPGQWQITVTHEMVGAPFTPPPTSISKCITPADSSDPKKIVESSRQPGQECEMKDLKQTANKVTYSMVCKRNGRTVSGNGEMTYEADHYFGTMTIEMENPRGGGQVKMIQHIDGKRTGDCTGK